MNRHISYTHLLITEMSIVDDLKTFLKLLYTKTCIRTFTIPTPNEINRGKKIGNYFNYNHTNDIVVRSAYWWTGMVFDQFECLYMYNDTIHLRYWEQNTPVDKRTLVNNYTHVAGGTRFFIDSELSGINVKNVIITGEYVYNGHIKCYTDNVIIHTW